MKAFHSDAVEPKYVIQWEKVKHFVLMARMHTCVLFINNAIIFSVRFDLLLEKKAIYFLLYI